MPNVISACLSPNPWILINRILAIIEQEHAQEKAPIHLWIHDRTLTLSPRSLAPEKKLVLHTLTRTALQEGLATRHYRALQKLGARLMANGFTADSPIDYRALKNQFATTQEGDPSCPENPQTPPPSTKSEISSASPTPAKEPSPSASTPSEETTSIAPSWTESLTT